ncbi:MAG: enolase C-terminal domain-like protein [Pseudomonadota bacterium]
MNELERIAVHRLRVPLATPYRLAFGVVEYYDTLIAELTDRDGRCGFGEATVLTGYTDETIEDSWRAARQLATQLAPARRADLPKTIQLLGENYPFTATAFATALEMLENSGLLQVPRETAVPLVGLLSATQEEAIRTESERLLAAGYRTIKIKVGFDVVQDAHFVKTVQRAVNGRARIRIDANQGYSAEQGIAFVRELDPADIELFEQPCAAGDWDAHLAVARISPVPMMLDESIYGIADIDRAAQLGAAAYIKLKLMKLVTLAQLTQAIQHIQSLGMKAVLGNGVACDPGCWMEACAAAGRIDNAGEMNGFLKTRSHLFTRPLEFRDGCVWLKPGFTPQLDAANLKQHLVDSVVCVAGAASKKTAA